MQPTDTSFALPPIVLTLKRITSRVVRALLLLAVLTGGLSLLASLVVDRLWFAEVGFGTVFTRSLTVSLTLGASVALLTGAWLWANVRAATHLAPADQHAMLPSARSRRRVAIAAVTVIALASAKSIASRWTMFALAAHRAPFGQVDPVYHRDLSFFVFRLPVLHVVFGWLLSSLVWAAVIAVGMHIMSGGIDLRSRHRSISRAAVGHLSVLAGLLCVLKAWGYRLDRYDLLTTNGDGPVTGGSYTDVHVAKLALTALSILALAAGIWLIASARSGRARIPVLTLGALTAASMLAGGAAPALVHRLRVVPNERALEHVSIQRNIDATRAAFGLADVATKTLKVGGTLTRAAATSAKPTIENIRLWDPDVLLDQLRNLERGKEYYQFRDVDPVRSNADALGSREVMVSAREIEASGLPDRAQTWVNTHLVYTHGSGIAASRVDRVTPDGAPDLVVHGIPPKSDFTDLAVTEPALYYGETNGPSFVIVKTAQPELDYPKGSGSVTTTYAGTGGIPLKGAVRRSTLALALRDPNLLLSGALRADSRIMLQRNILERVSKVAPGLTIDQDPYLAVVDGRLKWVVDTYTTTDAYPSAQITNFTKVTGGTVTGSGNYIRDAAKFVVDARDGTITAYAWDETDPLLATWDRTFPGLLHAKSEMPPSLLEHIRYPRALFAIQTHRYATYHITDADSFYSLQDAWQIVRDPRSHPGAGKKRARVEPEYVLQALPGETDLTFSLVRSFTAVSRPNLSSYMVANSDPGNHGELTAYVVPSEQVVQGPDIIQARINQDPAVSQQLTLWGQQHSKVIRGTLFIVPINDTLLYVQPLYLRGQGSRFPELKRVVAVAGDQVQMSDTLTKAIDAILAAA